MLSYARCSFNLSKFTSYTVLCMHSCSNFSQNLSKVLVLHSSIHALLCEFSFNLSKFTSYTVLSMHPCANIFNLSNHPSPAKSTIYFSIPPNSLQAASFFTTQQHHPCVPVVNSPLLTTLLPTVFTFPYPFTSSCPVPLYFLCLLTSWFHLLSALALVFYRNYAVNFFPPSPLHQLPFLQPVT
jgi:hypothetical protein